MLPTFRLKPNWLFMCVNDSVISVEFYIHTDTIIKGGQQWTWWHTHTCWQLFVYSSLFSFVILGLIICCEAKLKSIKNKNVYKTQTLWFFSLLRKLDWKNLTNLTHSAKCIKKRQKNIVYNSIFSRRLMIQHYKSHD